MPPSMRAGNLVVCPKLGNLPEAERERAERFFKVLRDAYRNRVEPWFASVALALPLGIVALMVMQRLGLGQERPMWLTFGTVTLCWLGSVLFLKLVYYRPRYRGCIERLASMLGESPNLHGLLKAPYVISDEEERLRPFVRQAVRLQERSSSV